MVNLVYIVVLRKPGLHSERLSPEQTNKNKQKVREKEKKKEKRKGKERNA